LKEKRYSWWGDRNMVNSIWLFIALAEICKMVQDFALLFIIYYYYYYYYYYDRLGGIVVSVLDYRSGGPDSIPGTTKKKK
jgi:hypothetical protein